MSKKKFHRNLCTFIPPECDLRIGCTFSPVHYTIDESWSHVAASVSIHDAEGEAEIFGCPLVYGNEVLISYGDTLEIHSKLGTHVNIKFVNKSVEKFIHISSRPNYKHLLEQYSIFNSSRLKSLSCYGNSTEKFENGPVMLVTGENTCLRNNTVLRLLNYSCRDEWYPLLVDLCTRDPIAHSPGCLSITNWDHCCPYDEVGAISGSLQSISFPFGRGNHTEDTVRFNDVINTLSDVIFLRNVAPEFNRRATDGVFINAPHKISSEDLIKLCRSFCVTHILVIDDEYLKSSISRLLHFQHARGYITRKVYVHRSPSVDPLPEISGSLYIENITKYLYGRGKVEITPFLHEIPFREIALWDIQHSVLITRVIDDSIINSLCIFIQEQLFCNRRFTTVYASGIIVAKTADCMKILIPNLNPMLSSYFQRQNCLEMGQSINYNCGKRLFEADQPKVRKGPLFNESNKNVSTSASRKSSPLVHILVTNMKYVHY